jgi:hypothetical protein
MAYISKKDPRFESGVLVSLSRKTFSDVMYGNEYAS